MTLASKAFGPGFVIQTAGNYFIIALVPGLFFGGKPDETCCHSGVVSKWLKTQSVSSAGQNTAT